MLPQKISKLNPKLFESFCSFLQKFKLASNYKKEKTLKKILTSKTWEPSKGRTPTRAEEKRYCNEVMNGWMQKRWNEIGNLLVFQLAKRQNNRQNQKKTTIIGYNINIIYNTYWFNFLTNFFNIFFYLIQKNLKIC